MIVKNEFIKYLFIFCLLILFPIYIYRLFNNINRPLERWDEETNVKVIESVNLRKPYEIYLNGKIFFEKPPLYYAVLNLTSLIFETKNIYFYRSVSSVISIFIVLLILFFSYKSINYLGGVISFIVILLSNQLFVNNVHGIFATHFFSSIDGDTLMIFFMVLSYFLLFNYKNKIFIYLSAFMLSLGALTKGPLVYVIAISFFISKLIVGEYKIIKKYMWKYIFYMLVIPVLYYFFMYIFYGQTFLEEFFYYHLYTRTISSIEGHNGDLTYYLVLLTNLKIYPFFILYILCLSYVIFFKKYNRYNLLFPGISTILIIFVVSFVQTKLSWYILPFYPFSAIFIGNVANEIYENYFHKS